VEASVSVSRHRSGRVCTVVVSGEVDLATGPVVEDAIIDAVAADGVSAVEIDLSAVEFLDSSGIALLLKGRRAADERAVAYRVIGAHGIVEQVLKLGGVWAHLCGDSSPSESPAT